MKNLICKCCGKDRPISEYYANKSCQLGVSRKCKECTKKAARKNRKANIEYYRQYDKERASLPQRVLAREKYTKEYRKKNPDIYKAHNAVNNAVRDGRLNKPDSCECCGKEAYLEAHHCDYSKPLDVMWLCKPCHASWHQKNDVA